MNYNHLIPYLTASLLLCSSVSAQTYMLEPLEITSIALSQDELSATDAVEIFTQDDIEKAHVQNFYEFLNQQTSVITMPGYGNPFMQKIDLRGFGITDGYENIVITLNGRTLNNVDMAPQLLASIPPHAIERVEIIKSGGIVTGGDGANAGVINITTKNNDDKELTLYGGSYGTYNGSLYLGHSSEFYSISAQAQRYSSNGGRSIDFEGNTDAQELKNGALNITLIPTDALALYAGFQTTHTSATYGSYLTYEEYQDDPSQAGATNWGATSQEYDSDLYTMALLYEINSKWLLNAQASHEEKTSRYPAYSSMAEYDYDRAKLSLNFEDDALVMTLGTDYINAQRNSIATLSKRSYAAYALAQYTMTQHRFKAGYRYEDVAYDNHSDLDDNNAFSGIELGYNYLIDAESSWFANYTHSYQSADIDRLFNYTTGAYMGYVEPMEADSINIGYSNINSSNKFKISLFYTDLKNEIYYYADPTYVNSKNTNIDESHKYGLDFYEKFLVTPSFHVSLNYNYVKAIIDKETLNGDDYSGNELPGVPNHNAKVTLSYLPSENLIISLLHTYRSRAYASDDFNNNFTQKQEKYTSTDINLAYAEEHYEIFAKINNLFDQSNGLWIHDDTIYPVNFATNIIAGVKIKY